MDLVFPVRARLVTSSWAARVVSPLHDALTVSERQAVLAGNPDTYLHVTSPPLAGSGALDDTQTGEAQAKALRRLLDHGAYDSCPEPSVFVYRMREDGDEHTGVVAGVDLAGFEDGRVLGHERVQAARVQSLVRHYEHVSAQSELVALFHGADPAVSELIARVCAEPPTLKFSDAWGIEQAVWRADPQRSGALVNQLSSHRYYVADGHHRVAAALKSRAREDGSLLCVLYSQDQVRLHAFHRRVHGPVEVPELLRALASEFDVRPAPGPEVSPGSLGLYAAGRWHTTTPAEPRREAGAASLDVTVLHERVLGPLLGVDDVGDPRLDFIPGSRSLDPTTRACDEDGGVLFTLHAPAVGDLVSVAERGEVMSAKATYVQPKPRTGIFLH